MIEVRSRELVETLTRLRREAHITQTAFARRIHISQPTLAAFEGGRGDPRFTTAQRYAAGLGLRLQLSIYVNDDAPPPSLRLSQLEYYAIELGSTVTIHIEEQG